MMMYHYCMVTLTDQQWERIRHRFPEEHRPKSHPGRKPIATRDVLEAAERVNGNETLRLKV